MNIRSFVAIIMHNNAIMVAKIESYKRQGRADGADARPAHKQISY